MRNGIGGSVGPVRLFAPFSALLFLGILAGVVNGGLWLWEHQWWLALVLVVWLVGIPAAVLAWAVWDE